MSSKKAEEVERRGELIEQGDNLILEFIKDSGVMIADNAGWEHYRDVYGAFVVWVTEQDLLKDKLVPLKTNLIFSMRLGRILPDHLKGKRKGLRAVLGYHFDKNWLTPKRWAKIGAIRDREQELARDRNLR